MCRRIHSSIKSSLLLPPYHPTKKFSLRLKRVEMRWDIFLIILIGRPLRNIFPIRIDSFLFFFSLSLSLECDSKRNSRKLLKDSKKLKGKKYFQSIGGGGSWKRIEISVPVRIGLNVTRHFPAGTFRGDRKSRVNRAR